MADSTVKIKIDIDNTSVIKLKEELRDTLRLMKDADGAAFDGLHDKANGLRDALGGVNSEVEELTTGAKFDSVADSLNGVGDAIAELNFKKAGDQAQEMAKKAKKITFKDAISSLKQMGRTFIQLGKAILTNPLFLIVAVVAAIITAIVGLLDHLGILEDIFKAVGDAINWVIQKLKDFLDWIGLTDFAAEDSARKQAEAQEKIIAAHEKKKEKVSDAYDHEIRMANIAGEATVELEREKQHAIIETSDAQVEALRIQMSALKAAGDLTKEKAKEIREAITELKKGIREAKQEIEAINATEIVEEKKKADKVQKVRQSSANNAKRLREQEAKNRLNAIRSIQNAELELMAEGEEKEVLANRRKYERLIEDTKNNETLLANEKLALITSFTEQEFQTRNEIQQKFVDEMTESLKVANEERAKSDKELVGIQSQDLQAIQQQRKDAAEEELARQELVKDTAMDLSSNLLSGISSNLKEGSKLAKGIAVAQTAQDTFRGAQAAFASTASNPISIAFPAAPFLAAASAIAMGIGNIRKILAVDSSGSGGTPSTGGTSQAPSFGTPTQTQQTPQMTFNTGINQNAGGDSMKQKVMVVDYHDIADKGDELRRLQEKVTLA